MVIEYTGENFNEPIRMLFNGLDAPALAQAKEDWRKKPTEGFDPSNDELLTCKTDRDCPVYEGYLCDKSMGHCNISAKNCRKSWGCKEQGSCKLEFWNGDGFAYCDATKKGCRKSLNCKEFGSCGFASMT